MVAIGTIGVDVVAAFAVLLLFAAAVVLRQLIANPLAGVSILGAHPFGFLASGAESLANTLQSWGESAARPLGDTWVVLWGGMRDAWGGLQGALLGVAGSFDRLITHYIPHAADWVQNNLNEVELGLTVLAHNLVNGVQGNLNEVELGLTVLVHNLVNGVQGNLNNVELGLTVLVHNLVNGVQGHLNEVELVLTADIQDTTDAIMSSMGQTAGATGELVDTGVSGVREAAGTLVGDVTGRLADGMTAGDAAGAVAAATGTAVVAKVLSDWLQDCGNPLCEGLGGVARDLPVIAGLLGGAALWEWLSAAMADPEGQAGDTISAIAPLATEAEATLRGLVGL